MARKLTDTQLIILSTASQREDRAVLPLPNDVKLVGGARTKSLQALIKRGVIEEVDGTPDWRGRETGDPKILRITDAGLAELGFGAAVGASPQQEATPRAPKRGGKTESILKLMRRKQGATIEALREATGWQPHSVRAALTGLRKKGIDVARDKNGKGETIYRAGA